ncbi:MAG: transposase [Planctomycetota bacterium]
MTDAINVARCRLGFDVWAWVFMPEHVHLIVCPRPDCEASVPDILRAVKEPVGRQAMRFLEQTAPQWLPRVTRRRGERLERLFWQSGGGYDRNVESPGTLRRMIEYIHENPVRRSLVSFASDWIWSSARWYLDESQCPVAVDPIPEEWLS